MQLRDVKLHSGSLERGNGDGARPALIRAIGCRSLTGSRPEVIRAGGSAETGDMTFEPEVGSVLNNEHLEATGEGGRACGPAGH
jgi:hypothetical protein